MKNFKGEKVVLLFLEIRLCDFTDYVFILYVYCLLFVVKNSRFLWITLQPQKLFGEFLHVNIYYESLYITANILSGMKVKT